MKEASGGQIIQTAVHLVKNSGELMIKENLQDLEITETMVIDNTALCKKTKKIPFPLNKK